MNLNDYLSDEALLTSLAELRAKQCVKRHAEAQIDRFFKRTGGMREASRRDETNRAENDPGTYLPPRRLWSRATLEKRTRTPKDALAKLAILRHARWVLAQNKLPEFDWGRRFLAFADRVRARVSSDSFAFTRPVSFAVRKAGKDDRFVTSFKSLEDKVILRQVSKYLRRLTDPRLSSACYSFRQDGSVDHTVAVKALVDFRRRQGEKTLFVAECDIRKFFDVIDHGVAERAFRRITRGLHVDPRAARVFRAYLAAYTSTETLPAGASEGSRLACRAYVAKIQGALDTLPDGGRGRSVGIPQGGALSGLIANWVLDEADRHVQRRSSPGTFYARYCDDIVIVDVDRRACGQSLARYLRAMKRLHLPVHAPEGGLVYGPSFFSVKSKEPYAWREIVPWAHRHAEAAKTECGAAPWVAFLGNQISFRGEVRVRRDSIARHLASLKQSCRRILGLCHAARNPASDLELRKGGRGRHVTLAGAARALMKGCVSKGVGYLRAGPFATSASDIGWLPAFPDVCGRDAELQLRQLDAARARLFYPIQKLVGLKCYFGRPASYHGFLKRVARPGVGTSRKPRAGRLPHGGYAAL